MFICSEMLQVLASIRDAYRRALLLSYMPLGQFQVDQRERTQVIVRPETVSCPFLRGSGKIQRQTLP